MQQAKCSRSRISVRVGGPVRRSLLYTHAIPTGYSITIRRNEERPDILDELESSAVMYARFQASRATPQVLGDQALPERDDVRIVECAPREVLIG